MKRLFLIMMTALMASQAHAHHEVAMTTSMMPLIVATAPVLILAAARWRRWRRRHKR
ncbi:hypothetical protein [Tateyamaria sp. ANG-S1]|uniref:hypothetical protein n=1 Tax=Tateyamaria sp. ANG-S1 TaxID=1577905 RepID=UPI00187C62A9|nr:hypothetical protein [Tateyamaria sp. ANG-S1]